MSDGMTREVERSERALYDAMIARDFPALDALLAPDLVYVHSTGVAESRQEYLEGVERGRYEYQSISSRNVRVRLMGSVALSDGVCDMLVGACAGPKALIHLLFVLVWVKHGPGWQLVHRHATRLPDA